MSISHHKLALWNNSIATSLAALGRADFTSHLVDALRHIIDFDICMVFAYGTDVGSVALDHTMQGAQAKLLVDDYLNGPHLLDPFYVAATHGKKAGFAAMRDLAPDRFYHSEFYRHHYVRTGIADEIGVFFPVTDNRVAVLSITRQRPKRVFSEAEKKHFAGAAAIIAHLGSKQWGARTEETAGTQSSRGILEILNSFGQDVLTQREREIATLILKGHSTLSVAHSLEISAGTVKNHRKHIYTKLKISSQAELFSLFLNQLEDWLS